MNKFLTGTLENSTPLAVNVALVDAPGTATLSSVAAGRLIEFSTDNGVNYFSPELDANVTGAIVVSFTAPISHVRFTGAAANVWSVR